MSLDARLGYLGSRVFSANIDWSLASYALLNRLAYVDIFGSVIGVKLVAPEQGGSFRQWNEALAHVFQLRFLFPGKASLSDTEVFVRLARGDVSEQMRTATSISVGYMSENYADLGFPGMLAGMFMIGLVAAAACRYFMAVPMPWIAREGVVLAFVFAIAHNGVEISLPKLLGAMVMSFAVYALLIRFAFPIALRWLDTRAAAARHQEMRRQQARAATHNPLLK